MGEMGDGEAGRPKNGDKGGVARSGPLATFLNRKKGIGVTKLGCAGGEKTIGGGDCHLQPPKTLQKTSYKARGAIKKTSYNGKEKKGDEGELGKNLELGYTQQRGSRLRPPYLK